MVHPIRFGHVPRPPENIFEKQVFKSLSVSKVLDVALLTYDFRTFNKSSLSIKKPQNWGSLIGTPDTI